MIGCLGFLHRGGIYKRRGDARRWATYPGGTPVRPGGGSRPGVDVFYNQSYVDLICPQSCVLDFDII